MLNLALHAAPARSTATAARTERRRRAAIRRQDASPPPAQTLPPPAASRHATPHAAPPRRSPAPRRRHTPRRAAPSARHSAAAAPQTEWKIEGGRELTRGEWSPTSFDGLSTEAGGLQEQGGRMAGAARFHARAWLARVYFHEE
ncbi:hypothetical protein ZWY2020_002061 [Hordeum vulgare]|nr:hypothetical protein ZWY2020_002061 [Hordeum vulgare]